MTAGQREAAVHSLAVLLGAWLNGGTQNVPETIPRRGGVPIEPGLKAVRITRMFFGHCKQHICVSAGQSIRARGGNRTQACARSLAIQDRGQVGHTYAASP
jgi:hypothetical protein